MALTKYQKATLAMLGLAAINDLEDLDKKLEDLDKKNVQLAGSPPPPATPGPVPMPGQTIAQGAAHAPGGKGAGHHVVTAKGAAHYHVPLGGLIIAHPHWIAGAPGHMAKGWISQEKWIANQWKKHAPNLASEAVEHGTHHWVQSGEHKFAVHQGVEVHVPKHVDIHDEAAVANAPKALVHHGDKLQYTMLDPKSGPGAIHTGEPGHEDVLKASLKEHYKPLYDQPSQKSVEFDGKTAAWVPHDWAVYKGAMVGVKWAKDPQDQWHMVTKSGKVTSANAGDLLDKSVANGTLVPEDGHAPSAGHVVPNQGEGPGPGPGKVDVGGVSASKEEIQSAIAHLQAAKSTNVKGPLKAKGHPLADMDYMGISKEELAKHPDLAVSPGTKKQHVGKVKLAVLHHLAGKLGEFAQNEADEAHAQQVQEDAQAAAAHAEKLTPAVKTWGGIDADKDQLQEAADWLESTMGGKQSFKQAMNKTGNPLSGADYMGAAKDYLASHLTSAKGWSTKKLMLESLKELQGQAAQADVETKYELHAGVAEKIEKVASSGNVHGSLKPGWPQSANGAAAAGLVFAAKHDKPIYASLGPVPGEWVVKTVKPDAGKSYTELTPQHQIINHALGAVFEAAPNVVEQVVNEWLQEPSAPESPAKVEFPTGPYKPTVTKLKPKAEPQPAFKEPAEPEAPKAEEALPKAVTKPLSAIEAEQWKASPEWPGIDDAIKQAAVPDVPILGKHATTNQALANALWSATGVDHTVYMHAKESGFLGISFKPLVAGSFGAQSPAGFYKVTPDHQVHHIEKDGSEVQLPADMVAEIVKELAPKPAAPEPAKPEAPAGFDVHVGGHTFHAPEGAQVYLDKNNPAGNKYISEQDGSWHYMQPNGLSGEINPSSWSYMQNQADNGSLVSDPEYHPAAPEEATSPESEGKVKVSVNGMVKYEAAPGTTLWYSNEDPSPDTTPDAYVYLKGPDGNWQLLSPGAAGPTVSANSAQTLNDGIVNGELKPYGKAAEEYAKKAGATAHTVPKAHTGDSNMPAGAVSPDIPVKLADGTVLGHAPGGSKLYYYVGPGGKYAKSSSSALYVKKPDSTWWLYNKAYSAPLEKSADAMEPELAAGHLVEDIPGQPPPAVEAEAPKVPETPAEPEVPKTQPVVFNGELAGDVPLGSTFYEYNTGYSSQLYIKAPDGTWYYTYGGSLNKTGVNYDDKQVSQGWKEVPPPSAQDVENAHELVKVKKLLKTSAVGNDVAKTSWTATAIQHQVGMSPSSHPFYVIKTTGGLYKVTGYLPDSAEHWKVNPKTFTAEHYTPKPGGGYTLEKVPFDVLKDAASQHAQPNSVLVGGKAYKYGFYYSPKGKAFLEVKAAASHYGYNKVHKYGTGANATYIWHKQDGTVETKTPTFAQSQLEKNTEYHELPKTQEPTAVSKLNFVTTPEAGQSYGLWTPLNKAKGSDTMSVKGDGSGVYSGGNSTIPISDISGQLGQGSMLDKYGTTVVEPGTEPTVYHLFGSGDKTKDELEQLLSDLQETASTPGAKWALIVKDFFGGSSGWAEAASLAQPFFSDHGTLGEGKGNAQFNALLGLLNELLNVPSLPAGTKFNAVPETTEPKFLKGLPPGIEKPQDIFTTTKTGYAHQYKGSLEVPIKVLGSKPDLVAKIKAVSDQFGGGKVVGTHTSGMSADQLISWINAWKTGDMKTVFNLDAAGGKVSPVHPGAPDNTVTHLVKWAAWDPGQVPATVAIEGNWTPLDVSPSKAEVDNYLIKANLQHAAYLTLAQRRDFMKHHRQHAQEAVDLLSQLAQQNFTSGKAPQSEPPVWSDDVKPAKSYDVYLEDGKATEHWTTQALKDYAEDHNADLTAYASQYAQQAGYGDDPQYVLKNYPKHAIQPYLDEVKAKEEAEKLRPKYALVEGKPGYVQDQFGHEFLWHAGTDVEMSRRTSVSALARAWGFKTPLARKTFLEADKTKGTITPEVQPIGTLAHLPGGIGSLTQRELTDIAREHVLDYALANPASTPGSYLRMADGSVISASKEDAYTNLTWAGDDRTGMNDWAKQPVSLAFDAIDNGTISKELVDGAYIGAVQAARRMAMLKDGRLAKTLEGTALTDKDIATLTERKNSLATKIQALWDSVYAKAGWTVPEVPEAKLSHGLHSGFSEPDFHPHVLAAKSFGVPAFFAGTDLAGNHIHVWTEIDTQKNRRIQGETTIRGEALEKVVGWVNSHSGDAAAMAPKEESGFHLAILKGAEVVNTHNVKIADFYFGGPLTAQALQEMDEAKSKLKDRQSLAEQAISAGAHSTTYAQFVKAYGDPIAVQDMAKYYLNMIQLVTDRKDSNQGIDINELPGWKLTEHASVAAGGVKVTYKQATRELGTNGSSLDSNTWQLNKGDGELHLQKGLSTEYKGYVWEVTLPTGEVIEVSDSSTTQTPKSSIGRMRFRAVTGDGSASLERIRSFLQEAGLPLEEATPADMEVLYWRMAAWVLSDRADRKSHPKVWDEIAKGLGAVNAGALVGPGKKAKYIGELPGLLIKQHLPAEEEAAVWRKAWAHVTNEKQINDFVDNHGYLPHLGHYDIRNPEMLGGKPDWYRFDVTPEQVAAKQMVTNSFSDSTKDAALIARTGGLYSSEARLRALGTYKPGMSWGEDQVKGSSGTVFLRMNHENQEKSAWVSPRVLARLQTYTFADDKFGDIEARRTSSYWDFNHATQHTGGGNEAMVMDAVSLLDDIEVLKVYNESQRKTLINDLKEAGITMIRGLPVEDRIVTSSGVKEAVKKAREALKKNFQNWFTHPASDDAPDYSEAAAKADAAMDAQSVASAENQAGLTAGTITASQVAEAGLVTASEATKAYQDQLDFYNSQMKSAVWSAPGEQKLPHYTSSGYSNSNSQYAPSSHYSSGYGKAQFLPQVSPAQYQALDIEAHGNADSLAKWHVVDSSGGSPWAPYDHAEAVQQKLDEFKDAYGNHYYSSPDGGSVASVEFLPDGTAIPPHQTPKPSKPPSFKYPAEKKKHGPYKLGKHKQPVDEGVVIDETAAKLKLFTSMVNESALPQFQLDEAMKYVKEKYGIVSEEES